MESINCVIIDDEQSGIDIMIKLINDYANKFVILKSFLSATEAMPYIIKNHPQVVFTDIEMETINGIELKQMLSEYKGIFVYVTAHSNYAIKALKANAFDYLLKPIKISEFIELKNKIQNHFLTAEDSDKNLMINTIESIQIVKQKDIIMVHGDGSYCHLHLNSQKTITASKNLGQIAQMLNRQFFFRCHQSYIVNIKYIQSILKSDGLELQLSNGQKANLSKSKRNELIQLLNVG